MSSMTTTNALPLLLVLSTLFAPAESAPTVFPGEGYSQSSYTALTSHVEHLDKERIISGNWCLAHGNFGKVSAVKAAMESECSGGVAFLGAFPDESDLLAIPKSVRVLVVAAELDGVSRFSSFAVSRHRFHRSRVGIQFIVLEGAAHHSFVNSGEMRPTNVKALDIRPELGVDTALERTAEFIWNWLNDRGNLHAERRAAQLAKPIVQALELEGSPALGVEVCNSDFPTNPSCNYPKFPDFSLPPGPAPAPSPLPASNCICGSKWVTEYAFPSVSGGSDEGFKVQAADAFHDVSDTHPFHLPHIWNQCSEPAICVINVTTLTMLVNGSGTLFPNASSPPISALELRTKMKSRQTLWEAAGHGKQSVDIDKKNMTICRNANNLAWSWAISNAEESVRQRFLKNGEPFVMVDDVEAPIGITGPEWIKKELVYKRVPSNSNAGSHIEVQSWTFVVGESPIKTKYLPTGMHYCKLLSPARCMEWIYTDGLRTMRSVE